MSMRERDPLIGRQIGAYLIQAKLGEGGMARVYKAYHARLRREVAIKVISSHIADHADFQARFEREAQLVASLEHRNIVAVYDFGEEGNLTYLVMQYVAGGSLRERLHNGQPLEPRRAARYALQMARALHHAHQHGIVHRDVKPQNMLVSTGDDDQLLLSDFGIAKLFDTTHEPTWTSVPTGPMSNDLSLTNVDQIIGTADYMAPEQITKRPVDARSDVYSLGVVLYQLLTGRVPFQSTTLVGLMYQHVTVSPKPVREINPAVPEILAQITARALEKDPEARFQSAEAMAQALEMALTSSSTAPALFGTLGIDEVPTYSQVDSDFTGTSQYHGSSLPTYSRPQTLSTGMPHTTLGSQGIGTLTPPPTIERKQRALIPHRMQTVAVIVFILLTLAFIAYRILPQTGISPPTGQSGSATAFDDHFKNNERQWIEGDNSNGLSAHVLAPTGQYTLTTDSADTTHFSYPKAVGTLPSRFTLTAQIAQTKGATAAVYGIVFYLSDEGTQRINCYAFMINNESNFSIMQYKQGALTQVPNWFGTSNAIHTAPGSSNTLSVVANDTHYSFTINGTPVQSTTGQKQWDDTTYTSGKLGLLVAGPNTNFIVTQVQLSIP